MAFRTRTFDASLEALAAISEFVVTEARAAGLDEHAVWEVQLAVDEAATNVIQHSYKQVKGSLTVAVDCVDNEFLIQLNDRGKPFDPDNVPEPDLVSPLEERKTGGLGLYLMRKLMDRVEFTFHDGENVLLMAKRINQPDMRVVELRGRIDAGSAPDVRKQVRALIDEGVKQIVVELRDVTFLSSSGLRALLLLARELRKDGGDLMLCALQPQVAEVFHLTGFDQIFKLHHTREEAVSAFSKVS
jgi:anti-anti-sigma factor